MQTTRLRFNSSPSTWMHIDLNSCFATIEQQANPHLRNKPVAVAAYTTPRGCILAPSIEAKRFGIKTGMQVQEGKTLCPNLIVLPSDPPKYRFVNRALLNLFNQYSPAVFVRSIDEMLLDFKNLPILKKRPMKEIGYEIKKRIKNEIGEWLTVSIGISTNPYLAKVAAGLHKPDGLDEINRFNILNILSCMKLTELPYIKERNAMRLLSVGIKTTVEFYFASHQQLKSAFESINGYYWYLRLHGLSIDEVEWQRRSIGHSYALPRFTNDIKELKQLLCKLVEKMGKRLRNNHLTAEGIHLAVNFADWSFWHKGRKFPSQMYASSDLFNAATQLLQLVSPLKPVRVLAISCFALEEDLYNQMALFHDEEKKRALTKAVDIINDKWGEFAVIPATMMGLENKIIDRIAFQGVRDMPHNYIATNDAKEKETYLDV